MSIISIRGTIGWDVTPDDIRNQIKAAKGDITVEIASPGGFVFDGLDIFNLIRDYKGGKVTTKLMGLAASMASVIALAGDKVIAHDNAVFMIHNASNIVWGNHLEMREMADHLEKVSNHLAKIYVRKTGKSINEIKALLDADSGSGTFLFGDEIKKAGFVDEIIESDDSNALDKDSSIISAMLEIENCTNKLKESEHSKKDLQKAAASLVPLNIKTKQPQNFSPAIPEANNQTKQDIKMETLAEFLAKNPSAKKEHEDLVAKAVEAANKSSQENAEKASSFMTAVYPKNIHEKAIAVIKGESDMNVLEAMAGMIDVEAAQKAIDDAAKDTNDNPDTPPDGPKGGPSAEEDFQARKIRING